MVIETFRIPPNVLSRLMKLAQESQLANVLAKNSEQNVNNALSVAIEMLGLDPSVNYAIDPSTGIVTAPTVADGNVPVHDEPQQYDFTEPTPIR